MQKVKLKLFPWALSLFPLLQVAAFISCLFLTDVNAGLAIFCFILATLFMSFNIHIFLHECVHHNSNYSELFNYMASLLVGLPFDGYRIHHYNHHYHVNGPGDFSTTWIYSGTGKRPRGIWSYAFGWHRQLLASLNCFTPYPASEESIRIVKQRTHIQKRWLALTLVIFLLLDWRLLLTYLLLIYFGWFFTALHNYGQHPPRDDEQVRTFANKTYNRLFFNNGLHWEHHHNPALCWHELEPSEKSHRINRVHFLDPIFGHRS